MTRWSLAPALGLALGLAAAPGCNVITKDLLPGPPSDADPPADAPSDTVNPTTDKLVLHYAFEETAGTNLPDRGPRAMSATLSDPAMWTPMGRTGRGIQMQGTTPATQYVSLPNGVLTGIDDFSISVWIKLTSNPVWARIYDMGNGLPDPANRFMYLTTNGFTAGMSDGIHAASYGGSVANESIVSTSTFLPLNVWKHLALTGSGGQRRLYIDGFPAATLDTGPAVSPREMEPLSPNSWLGRSRFASDAGFPGSMDELRIYSRALTAAEIADLAWPKRDYAHWRFDEGTGAVAEDTSDHQLPTALANNAAWSAGRLGGAVTLGGGPAGAAGPHVVIAGNPLAACTSQLAISMWIRIPAYVPNSRALDLGAGAGLGMYLAPTDGTGMRFHMHSPNGTFDLVTASPPVPADSLWHHVAVTVDAGGVVVLYVDGAPVRTQPSAGVRVQDFSGAAVAEAFLGRAREAQPFFQGSLDELRIGCRAYTPDEIKNLAHP